MKSFKRTITALSLSAVLAIAGCGTGKSASEGNNPSTDHPSETTAASSPLKIKTSFYPMYEFTRQVAGDLAEVENLVPAGVEPHDWEPTPQDMAGIAEADVLVYNGAGMEGWIDQVLGSINASDLTVIEASKGLEIIEDPDGGHSHNHGHDHDHEGEHSHEEHAHDHDHEGEHSHEEHAHDHDHEGEHSHDEHAHDHDHEGEHSHEEHAHDHDHEGEHSHDEHAHDHEHEGEDSHDEHDHGGESGHHHHDHGGLDPHVWLSPVLAIEQVRNIEAGLSAAAPEHKEAFKANADAYISKLEALDQEFRDGLKDSKRKDFITQHSAFGYLAREYGLTQVPIAGLSPDQEPSAAQMASVIEFAKEHEVKTIFFETLVSSKVAEAIAAEIGASTSVLNPIEGLTQEDIAANLDYISIMRQNLEALKTALNE
ncbi:MULTISPECIES: metal ABC transporter substrate-binding protein [Paenibacillus]|uniref:ABC transporter substrate-binding protein n=1 Tax=Paenibacillus campinasensis TaxID=66347 RepID=A0ABW9T2G4_9BACL|nr:MULTISPECIES: metal ABC transporter substrate-binding protein [Paenibacillus]MUG66898.1 ABC transporter substrate-binding protein [Paenibacillus campinasensis]PAK55911.1 ABC transporter substrate-binding protein [Paenibacillus sp. 7541]